MSEAITMSTAKEKIKQLVKSAESLKSICDLAAAANEPHEDGPVWEAVARMTGELCNALITLAHAEWTAEQESETRTKHAAGILCNR